ncbi:hypothetical protein [Dyadobacter pollutisoli]|uniref:DUF4465 domain-containing protein n=1 Tax=Dyadobacter pollutisoli TaxID=2910158 RepID=A0A9E8SJZ1_9BACT|nr:hypothetical protein [Dyadobacter pollutisoli]WAC11388.1 hypothetical protein ON006_27105 [Dyadobacter pollutisoli]
MNLVQKLPIGLSLACLMFMSSCSKEDALTPEPQTEIVNAHSSLKEGAAALVITLPYFPSTKGSTGLDVYPTDWERDTHPYYSNNSQELPTGTSNLSCLWGNPMLPWKKGLPTIASGASIVNFGSIVTTTSYRKNVSNGKNSAAKTKITNLKPGKKYEISFYVASTICSVNQNAFTPLYANTIYVDLSNVKDPISHGIDVEGKEATWVKKTVIFDAISTEMSISFSAFVPQNGGYSYAHMFVNKNAIKQLN